MIKIAIVGSREYPLPFLVRAFVRRLAARMKPVQVISGAAPGVDTWAVQEARAHGLSTKEYPADWKTHGRHKAGRIRNSLLVHQADIVVAFWDLQSAGSRDSIGKAIRWGKRVRVFGPEGELVPVGQLSELLK